MPEPQSSNSTRPRPTSALKTRTFNAHITERQSASYEEKKNSVFGSAIAEVLFSDFPFDSKSKDLAYDG